MRRNNRFFAGLAACLALAACAPATGAEGSGDRLTICAGFSTMADFAGKIAGDRAEVVNLAPAGADPHDWEPSPKDVARLEEADLLILNGAGFEHWADSVLSSLQNKSLVVVDTSAEIVLREEHDPEEEEHGHDVDPHIWLDPNNAALQMRAIRDALTAADPDSAGYYSENYEVNRIELEALDAEYRDAVSGLPGRDIVASHQAYGYLCAAYGLNQTSARGLSPDGEPDPARMAEVIEYAREHRIRVVFYEEADGPKIAEAIARETGAEAALLSPLESLPEGTDYFTAMRENLEQLKKALA